MVHEAKEMCCPFASNCQLPIVHTVYVDFLRCCWWQLTCCQFSRIEQWDRTEIPSECTMYITYTDSHMPQIKNNESVARNKNIIQPSTAISVGRRRLSESQHKCLCTHSLSPSPCWSHTLYTLFLNGSFWMFPLKSN